MNGINKGTIHIAFNVFNPATEDARAAMKSRGGFLLTHIYHSFI